jgi:GNAT superfamily N-acetyltransferase
MTTILRVTSRRLRWQQAWSRCCSPILVSTASWQKKTAELSAATSRTIAHRLPALGPISIDPEAQNQGIGRKLMQTAIDHFTVTNVPGIRLVQAAYHNRSLCLYTRLGFQTREPLSVIQGPALNVKLAGYDVRPAAGADDAGGADAAVSDALVCAEIGTSAPRLTAMTASE